MASIATTKNARLGHTKVLFLNDFIFFCEEGNLVGIFDRISSVDFQTVQHLDITEGLAAAEGHCDWEEVVRVASGSELHTPTLVFRVNESVLPEESSLPAVVMILPVTLSNVGRAGSMRNVDADDDIIELEVGVLQLELNVDVASTRAVVAGPAVYVERNIAVVRGLIAPFENSYASVDWERLGGVLQPDDAPALEQLLVNVGVGLQLNALVVGVLQL